MHRKKRQKVTCAVLTISDTRTCETDESGNMIVRMLKANKHSVIVHRIVSNNIIKIQEVISELMKNSELNVIITTGGTGISSKDLTVEAISPFVTKRLDGFGELFRNISYSSIGSAAILSRAFAGILSGGKVVVCLPGSPDAVKVGMNLIASELGHILYESRR